VSFNVLPPQGHLSHAKTPVTQAPARGYWLSWRPAEPWERPVIDRAYAAGVAAAAATVKVAGR
jgi:hypothetical protein